MFIMWFAVLFTLLEAGESRLCNTQMMNCVCSNGAIQRLEVRIGLRHLLEKGNCNARKPLDCQDVYKQGFRENRVYRIYPDGETGFDVYCDMKTDGGGWTVIQRRLNGKTDFYRTWKEYKHGFGKRSKEYWLGNDNIHLLTKLNSYNLRVDLEDFKGVHKYAYYSTFSVGSESTGYVLNIGGYHGTAGDSLKYHNGRKFSTKDRDNDRSKSSCAISFNGAWWYDGCYHSNLNGMYMKHVVNNKSMNWEHFKNNHMSLKFSEMKIKRKKIITDVRLCKDLIN